MEKYLNFGYLDLNKNMGTLNRLSNLFEILQKIKNASSVRTYMRVKRKCGLSFITVFVNGM